jgi:hypothetical protein
MVSRCCKADIYTSGSSDFFSDRQMCTQWYECVQCRKPCDTMSLDYQGNDDA